MAFKVYIHTHYKYTIKIDETAISLFVYGHVKDERSCKQVSTCTFRDEDGSRAETVISLSRDVRFLENTKIKFYEALTQILLLGGTYTAKRTICFVTAHLQ